MQKYLFGFIDIETHKSTKPNTLRIKELEYNYDIYQANDIRTYNLRSDSLFKTKLKVELIH